MKVGSVLGHYHVVRTLGRGGMGAVYEANDTRLNRQVALKVLPARMASNPEWFKRFEREAQAVAALNHPNIVTIHSVEEADDVHFIILELVGGETLEDLIPEDGLPLDQFFDIAIPLTDAIAAAHKRGIAHRDLKPSNVMVDEEGRVKVLDFGIAKLTEEVTDDEAATQVGSEALTEEGKIVGTVAYMSPEQAEGKAADSRTDIFSLGIILYEMATGDRPFVGDTKLSIMASIVKDNPPTIIERNLEMPRHLARIVKKALEKDLSRRYQSMVELRNDLVELKEEIDAGEMLVTGGSLTDPGTMDAYRAPPKASPWGKWIGAAGLVVAALAVGWAAFFGGGGSESGLGDRAEIGIEQLTSTAGTDFGGSISPDGEWFVYSRETAGTYRVQLQSVGSRTPFDLAEGASPAFSTDGAQIAFSDAPQTIGAQAFGGGISIMGRAGDDQRRLTDFGFNPAWSPDDTKIVFATEFVSSRPYTRSARGSSLLIYDLDTNEQRELVSRVQDGVQPSWSPSGERIAYWANRGGLRNIWTVPADGSESPRPVTETQYVDFSPVWSPDGQWLYFASTRGGSMAIWRVAINQSTGEVLADPEQITIGGVSEPGMLSISSDGNRLLYTDTITSGNISAAGFDAATLALTSSLEPVVEGQRRLLQPDISPDGEWLAYRTEGAQQDILVAHVDGSDDLDERRITDDLAKEWSPAWSPDGFQIAYYANTTGSYQMWVVDADGTSEMRLTDYPDDQTPIEPKWAPDGSAITYYITNVGGFRIDPNVGFADQQPEPLGVYELPDGGDGTFQSGDWNAAGTHIVGTVNLTPAETDQTLMVVIYDVASQQYTDVIEGSAPFWMADQQRIVFRVSAAAGFYVYDPASGDITHLDVGDAESVVLSPENDRIYVNRWQTESDIWMIDLTGGEQTDAGGSQ